MARRIKVDKISPDGFTEQGQSIEYNLTTQKLEKKKVSADSPLEISDCVLWLNSDTFTSSLTPISSWQDQSGAGNNFNVSSSTLNAWTYGVQFPSAYSPYMVGANGALTHKTLFYLAFINSYQNAACCPPMLDANFHGENGAALMSSQWSSSSIRSGEIRLNGNVVSLSQLTKDENWKLISFRYPNGNDTSFSQFPQQDSFTSRGLVCTIKEIIAYNKRLNDTENNLILKYLSLKHAGTGPTITYI